MSAAEQLYMAASWYLEEGTEQARESLAGAVSRFEVEGDPLKELVQEAVAERDARIAEGLPLSEWHVRARLALRGVS